MWGFKKGGWFQAACTWHAHAAGMCIRDVERCTGAGRSGGNENGMHMPQACAFVMWRGAPVQEGEVHRGGKKGRE